MTRLWARENSQYPGKEVDGGSQKKETEALAHSHPRPAHAVALPHSSDIDTELARSQRTDLHYFLLICTWFSSTHPPAIGKYYHYPRSRSKTAAAALQVRSTSNGADARFPQPGHPRWSEQGEICQTMPGPRFVTSKCAPIKMCR
jgi:hypothetical protein